MTQAFIQAIEPKETKAGTMYDITFSNGDKVGAGKFLPKGFAAGDYVNYEVKMNGNFKNLAAGSLSKATPPAGVSAPKAETKTAPVSYDKRQETISKQAALNSAMTMTNLLVAADALPSIPKSKAGAKADIIEEIVMRYTAKFYNMATGETYDIPEESGSEDLSGAEEATNWNE